MAKILGLRRRLCPACGEMESHRTLYVRAELKGKAKWVRIFWACTGCRALNHVVVPTYRLLSVPSELPSPLVAGVVGALKDRPMEFDELIQSTRGHCPGVRHVFNSEVKMVLEYLERRGVVTEQEKDLTGRTLEELRTRPNGASRLAICPVEAENSLVAWGLLSIYAQFRRGDQGRGFGEREQSKLAPVGSFCVRCGYREVDPALFVKPERKD
jgi:hypothetical protein